MSKKAITSPINAIQHGRYSKHVKSFLARHGLESIELPSTGRFAQDMALSLALYQEKQDAIGVAVDILRSHDARALGLFNQLVEINLLLSKYESEIKERGGSATELIENPQYIKWQSLKMEIVKHYEKMRFDLEKIKVEQKVKDIKKGTNDTLFVVTSD